MLKRGGPSVQARFQNLVGEVSHLGSNLGDSLAQKLHLSPPPPAPEGDLVDLYGFPLPRNQYENYYRAKVKFDKTVEKQRKAMGPLSATLTKENPEVKVFAGVVKNGVPEEFRPAVWPLFIEQHSSVRRTVGIYEQLLKTDKKNIAVAVSQISKDIHRTFPYYGGDNFRQKLKRVLQAYAAYNPTLGYCQAMNFLAGGLLVFCPEDVAFWMLTSIVDELLNEYFCETMTGSIADCAVLEELLSAKYPQLIEHLNSCGMPIQLIVTQWFMCLFINTLPTITAFQVWDLIFYNGATVLFEVAIAIFKMAQKGVMQLTDQVDIVYFLNDFAASIFDINKLFDEIQPLDKLEVLQLRMKHRIRIIGEAKKKDNFKLIKYVESHTKFGPKEMDELFSYFQREGSMMDEGVRLEAFLSALQIVLPQLMNTEDQHLYFDDPEPVSHRLFGLFDVNGDNIVNLRELICGISVMCKGTLEDRLRMCFKVFSDSQGQMHKPHLASLLSTLYGMYYDKGFQKEISFFVDMIFMDADINSDGHLTFEEFQGAAEQQPFLMKCFRVDSATGPQISSPKQNKPAVLSDPEEWVVM